MVYTALIVMDGKNLNSIQRSIRDIHAISKSVKTFTAQSFIGLRSAENQDRTSLTCQSAETQISHLAYICHNWGTKKSF